MAESIFLMGPATPGLAAGVRGPSARSPMPTYRVTVRHGQPRYRYHVEDVDAQHLGEAMARAAERLPPEVAQAADVAEVRRLVEPENRELSPG